MASLQKTNSKMKKVLPVKDEEETQDKFCVSSGIRKFGKNVKEKLSMEKTKLKHFENKHEANTKNININFIKNPNFNLSSNNNYYNNFTNIHKKCNYPLSLENKNENNKLVVINNSNTIAINDQNKIKRSQKQLENKLNEQNNTQVNSLFNVSNYSNPNSNYSLKNQKENNQNNQNDKYNNYNFYQSNKFNLHTQPEKQGNSFLSTSNKNFNIPIKKVPVHLETNQTNAKNIANINFKNYRQVSNTINNQEINHSIINKVGEGSSYINNLNNIDLQLKKSSSLINLLNNSSLAFNNASNNNLNNSNRKQKSNSKSKKMNTKEPLNLPDTVKNLNGIFTGKKDSNLQLESYSSHNDFIEEFFLELLHYNNNANKTFIPDEDQKQSQASSRVFNIFDNIFKKIITGQKPMESLDIEIKKKLSKFSDIWKNFLRSFEKDSLKSISKKNPCFINNIDLYTKNVIKHSNNYNHNHKISSTETSSENHPNCIVKMNNKKNLMCGLNCYSDLKKELDVKFTNLMKREVNKINKILEEKEKVIEDLQNQINIKNSYISEMQQGFNNNKKSKELGASNEFLRNENYNISKDTQDKASSDINNLEPGNKFTEFISEKKNLKNNKQENLENNNSLKEEAENFFLKKKTTDTIDEQTELLLYDQKQFIRERRLLISENKTLFDKVSEMEKLLNFQKEKEIKLMKLLFFLNKQGIPIDEIIQTHILTEKSCREEHSQNMRESSRTDVGSYKSMESLMYLPITLEQPTHYVKPQVIPVLDFTDINTKYNMEYDSDRKSNHLFTSNNKHFTNEINESSTSFIDYNKIESDCNYDNSIINDISKLDHKKNREVDLRLSLNKEKKKKKEYDYLLKNSNDNIEISNTLKNNVNSPKLNLNTNNKENNKDARGYSKDIQFTINNGKERSYCFVNTHDSKTEKISPDINKVKSVKEIRYAKNGYGDNLYLVPNLSKFTEFSNDQIDKSNPNHKTEYNKGNIKTKLFDSSNNNNQNNNQISDSVSMNSSDKKNPNYIKDENFSSIKNSSTINITEQSISKLNNDKVKLNLNLSLKDKMKALLKTTIKKFND